jgi:hypothetical protein
MCCNTCNECPRKVYSNSVSVVTVAGVDTLVIDIPQQAFRNCDKGCLVITQAFPEAATIYMPVAISIGGVTTTVYSVVACDCNQVTAPMLRTRRRYPFKVSTNGTTGVFKILKNLSCAVPQTNVTIPVVTTTTPGG